MTKSLSEVWERIKELFRRCLRHRQPRWMQVQIFNEGLVCSTITTIDTATGGSLIGKSIDETFKLLKDMTFDEYQCHPERFMPWSLTDVCALDAISHLTTQVVALSQKLDNFGVSATKPLCFM